MASDPTSDPSLLEVMRAVIAAELREVHTTLPGVVTAYDPVTQRAHVQPVIRAVEPDGTFADRPVIPHVPVRFPYGKGFTLIWPLEPGDHVDLHFVDDDPSAWRNTGQMSDPLFLARHGMFAYATPGCRPDGKNPNADGAASATRLVIGREGGSLQIRIDSTNIELGKAPTDYVALASKVDARLDEVAAYLESVKSWAAAHVHSAGGSGTPTTALGDVSATPSVASTVVKCA